MKIGMNDDDTVDEVVAEHAFVHLEDMGNAYMLYIVQNGETLHLTIPHRPKKRAFVFEHYDEKDPTDV